MCFPQTHPKAEKKTDDSNPLQSYSTRYGQSKVALIGLMRNLSRQYPQIKCVAIHPGRILTGMARSLQKESLLAWLTKPIAPLFCVPVATGIRNHLWAATSPEVVSGSYYEPVGVPGTLSAVANDEAFYKRLQDWTDEALKGVDAPIQISSS
jgi:NAD(P)-dependent dehydrogenase (short-subunit alcohol dehydrogenase family)